MTRHASALVAFVLFASPAVLRAQSCPPGALCSPGAACPGLACGVPGDALHAQVFSAGTQPQAPPLLGLVVQLPRFDAPPGAQLLRAQIDFDASTVGASIRARNLTPNPLFNEQFTLLAAAQVKSGFAPLLPPGVLLPTCAVSFSDNLAPTTWPGPPAAPCEFGAQDSVSHADLDHLDGRRVCLDDPQLLAAQFLVAGGANTVDFQWDLLDSFQQSGSTGSTCTEYTDAMRVSVSVTYFFCLSGSAPGSPSCAGGGPLPLACPCSHPLGAGRGCPNSAGPGARLGASGSTSPDSVQLVASGMPDGALALVLQGSLAAAPAHFGDGLRCIGGELHRLYLRTAAGGALSAPASGEAPLRLRSAQLGDTIPSGGVRHYMVWYRDPDPAFCPAPQGGTTNATNAYTIVWP